MKQLHWAALNYAVIFRKKYFFQYFLKSTNFSPSNYFFQLGNLRHAIPCSAPFLEILTLNIFGSVIINFGEVQNSERLQRGTYVALTRDQEGAVFLLFCTWPKLMIAEPKILSIVSTKKINCVRNQKLIWQKLRG